MAPFERREGQWLCLTRMRDGDGYWVSLGNVPVPRAVAQASKREPANINGGTLPGEHQDGQSPRSVDRGWWAGWAESLRLPGCGVWTAAYGKSPSARPATNNAGILDWVENFQLAVRQ